MKNRFAILLTLAAIVAFAFSGCEYDGGGSGFTQRDLELQRKQQERQFGR